jgi:streptogramin lyase
MSTRHRLRVGAIVATAVSLLLGLSGARASATETQVVTMPSCCASETIALGANVYTLAQAQPGVGNERATLVRIDPATNAITGSLKLRKGIPAGNGISVFSMAVAGGSIWVVAYFEDQVLRIDPATMTITAAIRVGRSPASIVSDGRSLWVALQTGRAVIRIRPAQARVVQRIHVGSKQDTSDGPWQLAYDDGHLLASMPSSGRVARINPRSSTVRYDAVGGDAARCARVLPVRGGYWLDDTECSNSYYRWDARTGRITVVVTPDRPAFGSAVVNNKLYTGEFDCTDSGCTEGHLVKRNAVTGTALADHGFGIEALLPHFAAGSFWVADFDNGTLQRVADF